MKKQVKIILALLIVLGVGIASISTIFWITLNQNKAPIILNYYPTTNPTINIDHTFEQEFNVTAYDPKGDPLTYSWYLNDTGVGENSPSYLFIANSSFIGNSTVYVYVSDGILVTIHSWDVIVDLYYEWSYTDCPGAPMSIDPSQIIKLGVIGDTDDFSGQGTNNGATLAAYEINSAGGIAISGKTYYIGLTNENSEEADLLFNSTAAINAANQLINYKRVQYALGSYRAEAALTYQPLFAEKKIIFFGTGNAVNELTQRVLDDYGLYKYYFQILYNSTSIAKDLISILIGTAAFYSESSGHNITRFSFIREDLPWNEPLRDALIYVLTHNSILNLTYTGTDIAFGLPISPATMDTYFSYIVGNNTQIVIPLITGPAGQIFANSYGQLSGGPSCIPIGINVRSQDSNFWGDTFGNCNYSVGIEAAYDTNKTTKTMPFWNAYKTAYGKDPIYTAACSYDAIYQLKWALNETQSFNPDNLVAQLETLTRASGGLEGATAWLAYYNSHSPVYGWPFSTGLALQWMNGQKNFLIGPGLYPSDPYSTMPPYGTMLNQTLMVLPPNLYFYD
ncbi:MAG: ABC transporter substrate-binding protein [Candidatus Hermodarchaeota archaeon]